MDRVSGQSWIEYPSLRILYPICLNLLVCIDRQHYYNIEVVSVGTYLNLYYIHDIFIPICFYFYTLHTVYFVDTCPLVGYVIFYFLLLSRSRLCHYSVGGAWWHLGDYESFLYPVRVISPARGVESERTKMTE
jgi:hypothetical protein